VNQAPEDVNFRRSVGISSLLHLAVIAAALLPPFLPHSLRDPASAKKDDSPPKVRMFRISAPPRPAPDAPLRVAAPANRPGIPPPAAVDDQLQVEVNLSRVQLSFADDLADQLPEVVRLQGGFLALIDPADPAFTSHVAEPPEWNLTPRVTDISRFVRLAMSPPERWAVWRQAARASGLSIDGLQSCALMGNNWRNCLREQIQLAASQSAPRNGKFVARSAHLQFRADAQCGVDVVSVAVTPATSP